MKINLVCQCCNKEFETDYKFRDKKFCSRECYFQHSREGKIKTGRVKDDSLRETRYCKVCGNDFTVKKTHNKEMCSTECRNVWAKNDNVKSDRVDKIKKTVKEKYGVDHVWNIPEIHNKTISNRDKQSSIEKQKTTVRKKHLVKLNKRLQESNLILMDEYSVNKNGNTSLSYNFSCDICGKNFQSTLLGSGIIPKCPKCFPNNRSSSLEHFITDFLDLNNIKYVTNTRKIISGELDIFIPSHNLGIETNGMYWHGELNGKDKNYHLNKTKECFDKGIRLIHILEEEIINKPEIVLSKISNILGLINEKVYARKCDIREVDNKTKQDFLNKNHIQGDTKDKIRLGLYYNDELVSLITFAKRKITRGDSVWEITRFASKINLQVVGGFSKLFKHFIKKYDHERIVTFADLRWSSYDYLNTVYNKNGFMYESHTKPSYWYFFRSNNSEKYHRFKFRKDLLVKEGFNQNDTEWDIMVKRGFDRIWDCGNIKFIYKK